MNAKELVAKWRKRPLEIEAVQLDGTIEAFDAAIAFVGGASGAHNGHLPDSSPDKSWLYINTQEGMMTAHTGDWIIRGVAGEFYPCKPDIFAATYEAALEPAGDAVPDPMLQRVVEYRPLIVADEWTDAQCVAFMATGLRHVEYKRRGGGPTCDEIRQGVVAALRAALEGERDGG